MFEALVFDLDDTLYLEKDFVMSGYRAVAHCLAVSGLCSFEGAFATMSETFESMGRKKVFSRLMEWLPDASLSLPDLIDTYRQHKPAIQLCPGYRELLRNLARDYRLGLITDGMPAVQKGKVHALGLEDVMDKIIYTWEFGEERQKPHPLSFSLMLEYLRTQPGAALYIGDNPEKDCRGAHAVGMKFAQVTRGAYRSAAVPDAEDQPEYLIESLFQLPEILKLRCEAYR